MKSYHAPVLMKRFRKIWTTVEIQSIPAQRNSFCRYMVLEASSMLYVCYTFLVIFFHQLVSSN